MAPAADVDVLAIGAVLAGLAAARRLADAAARSGEEAAERAAQHLGLAYRFLVTGEETGGAYFAARYAAAAPRYGIEFLV